MKSFSTRTRNRATGITPTTISELAKMATLTLTLALSFSSSTMVWAFSPMSKSTIDSGIVCKSQIASFSNMMQGPSKRSITSSTSKATPSTTLYSSKTSISSTTTSSFSQKVYKPVFDFMNAPNDISSPTHPINKFDRIDDAIMGGISTSSVRAVPDRPYCSWSGICREFGGGFCGMRTLPFVEPLPIIIGDNDNDDSKDADGLFVTCRLTSDNEPQRRVWKMTIRTDTSRGELVYQSEFKIPNSNSNSTFSPTSSSDQEWNTIHVPFSSFRQVRGPRLVPNGGEPLNITGGLYQIGMTMSKFEMGFNTTELENFRPGFFELQIQQIGLYSDKGSEDNMKEDSESNKVNTNTLQTVNKDEMMKQRPIIFKIAILISKIFFSERANRRKLAMNILRTKRNMTRWSAILFGLRSRSQSYGLLSSIGKTCSILAIDAFRIILGTMVKYGLFKPLQLVRKMMGLMIRVIKKGGGKSEGTLKKA